MMKKTIATKSMNPVTTCRFGIKNRAERLKRAFAHPLQVRRASRQTADYTQPKEI